ncbi:related to RNA helicase HEL117 [Rhynchosporium graminicola]|uniref:Related to RNA helicase HEL117 n=1 Tax=Rhynchosporium graminicola TaxID=2792576 RepID=A0A1E1JVR5_9HELO|nr:related to RNA helicase HEL117 [Rhynchosporium commune]
MLPFNSRQLGKRDYDVFKPMFATYLDIQKQKILEDMDETEVRGRWKSFVGKWNRGELSEGWYDPATFQRAIESSGQYEAERFGEKPNPRSAPIEKRSVRPSARNVEAESDSDDSIGPTLPGQEKESRSSGSRKGPSIPNMQDLELRKEMDAEDGLARREDIRFARKTDRKEQKAALDELVPRAEPGTRERQLEKKKEVNEKMKSFREKSPGAADVPDTELMGGGDGVESYKQEKEKFERKKNERELRKEEMLRARMAERDERLQEARAKEEGTMAMLKALAKQNFG